DVIHAGLSELVHALEASAGALVVLDVEGKADLVRAVGYDSLPASRDASLQPGVRTPIPESMRRQTVVTIESHRARALEYPRSAPGDFLSHYEATAVVPLVVGHRAIGAVALSFAQRRTFEEGEITLMSTAGRQVAQALERARGYERAERARAEGDAFR